MSKFKTLNQMFDLFASQSLPPDMAPQLREIVKLTYFKAARDILSFQHNVLGDPNMDENKAVATLQGWMDETEEYLGGHPHAKKQSHEYRG